MFVNPPAESAVTTVTVTTGAGAASVIEGTTAGAVPKLLEPRVAAHIERGRVAMRRLEEIFAKHPTLQSQEVSCSFVFSMVSSKNSDCGKSYSGVWLVRCRSF